MSQNIHNFVGKIGLSDWWTDVLASLIFVSVIMLSVVAVGFAVNRLEILQMRFLSRFFGIKVAEFICNRLLFVGTVVHELSHALFAVLSGAKVTKIRCFTLFSKDVLGYVHFIPRGNLFARSFQLAFSSCAPTITGCLLVFFLSRVLFLPDLTTVHKVLVVYVLFSVADHMSMSLADIKNYAKGGFVIFIVFFAFSFGFFHFFVI